MSIEEIKAIDILCGGISKYYPDYAFDVAIHYFSHGFVKGTRYAKAQIKKKQKLSKSTTDKTIPAY